MKKRILQKEYFQNEQVVELAKDLLGKFLFTNINNHLTGGMITETEAYAGITDKGSHAYNGRRTVRTEVMYQTGGISYVYFTYGIHYLFNVVTGKEGVPHAVLIRAVYPLFGTDIMLQRTEKKTVDYQLTNGPAKLTKSLGITKDQNNIPLDGETLWLEERGIEIDKNDVTVTPRIGINYAGEDALLPYRFVLNYKNYLNNKFSQ
jgi:DNA-3-methyladenine glycosylase